MSKIKVTETIKGRTYTLPTFRKIDGGETVDGHVSLKMFHDVITNGVKPEHMVETLIIYMSGKDEYEEVRTRLLGVHHQLNEISEKQFLNES
jgi:hypothetical protein